VGHPRVYCRVIADALATVPCQVVVAIGFNDAIGLNESPDLQPLSSRAGVLLVDTRTFSQTGKPHLTAEELVGLQLHFSTDTTLFIEADKSKTEFFRIAAGEAPRLRGRNLGIFANAAEWYPGEDSFTGQRRSLLVPTVRTTLGNVKRAIFNRRQSARYFYEKIIIESGVLDEILVKDERLANWRGPPVHWMPEISRPAALPESPEESAEFLRRRSEIECFLASNKHREPVLYFGDAAYYKGYDLFLEFVAATPSTCAIHAGRSYDAQQRSHFRCDVEALRAQLKKENRLYETNAYVHIHRLKELLFASIRLYITTHRLALSSSSVIQALELGKPVLVPDRGLLGYRVRKNNLGDVYNYEDLSDLAQKAEKLWRSDLGRFSTLAKSFWQRFSDEAIRRFLAERLLSSSVRLTDLDSSLSHVDSGR
jgi:glycosyltransferase involved in cell wall biosynthesis